MTNSRYNCPCRCWKQTFSPYHIDDLMDRQCSPVDDASRPCALSSRTRPYWYYCTTAKLHSYRNSQSILLLARSRRAPYCRFFSDSPTPYAWLLKHKYVIALLPLSSDMLTSLICVGRRAIFAGTTCQGNISELGRRLFRTQRVVLFCYIYPLKMYCEYFCTIIGCLDHSRLINNQSPFFETYCPINFLIGTKGYATLFGRTL
jgi:hypothetical protein